MVKAIRKIIHQKLREFMNASTTDKKNIPIKYKGLRPKEFWGNPQTVIPILPILPIYTKYKSVITLKE